MPKERSRDAKIYTLVAGMLLAGLLTFGILNNFGVFR